jgi:hypothetical protein
VVNRGSSGKTSYLFPTASGNGDYIVPGQVYTVPSSGTIRFDDQPGQGDVYVFVSQQRLPVSSEEPAKALHAGESTVRPANYVVCGSKDLLMEAPERLQQSCGVGSKDLFLEEDRTSATPAEYVVAPTQTMDEKGSLLSRKITLRHE